MEAGRRCHCTTLPPIMPCNAVHLWLSVCRKLCGRVVGPPAVAAVLLQAPLPQLGAPADAGMGARREAVRVDVPTLGSCSLLKQR